MTEKKCGEEVKDADWVEMPDVLSAIDRLEEQGQLVRPVANVLRKTLGAETPEEKPFELKHKKRVEISSVDERRLKKLSKGSLVTALKLVNGEMDDVRRIAEHYRGLASAEDMSVGAIHLLEVQARENDMERVRKVIGGHFRLNETQTDNLGNSGSGMVENLLNRFDCFADEVRRAMHLLDFVIEICEDDGCPKKVELLKTVRALFNMALHNKGEYRIE